mgnify:CR=1 FL=1
MLFMERIDVILISGFLLHGFLWPPMNQTALTIVIYGVLGHFEELSQYGKESTNQLTVLCLSKGDPNRIRLSRLGISS